MANIYDVFVDITAHHSSDGKADVEGRLHGVMRDVTFPNPVYPGMKISIPISYKSRTLNLEGWAHQFRNIAGDDGSSGRTYFRLDLHGVRKDEFDLYKKALVEKFGFEHQMRW